MGIGPFVTYGLSTTSSLIISDLGISDGQFGLLATVCFLTAALSSAGIGRLSDRLPVKAQLAIIFGGTACALVAIALAPSYWWLLIAVAIAGPGQSLSNPLTNRIIIYNVSPAKRGSWIGVKQSGVQASQLFAGLFFPSVALLLGWTGATAAGAVVALILMLWCWRRVGEAAPPGDGPGTPTIGEAATTNPALAPRRAPLPAPIWVLTCYSLFSAAALQATNVYLPLFAQRELDLSLQVAGLTAGLSGIVGVCSRVLWGRQMNAGVKASSLLLLLAIGAILGTLFLLLAGEFGIHPLLWFGVSLHGAAALGINAVVMTGLMREVPACQIGRASGTVALGLYSGFAIGPSIMGFLLEESGEFSAGWGFIAGCYALCAALALLMHRTVRKNG
jgi:predicted MFS family arabinose efflux permease